MNFMPFRLMNGIDRDIKYDSHDYDYYDWEILRK